MMKKSVKDSVIIVLALLLLVSFAGCAKPPTAEMSNAKKAFQDATDAGAQKYAPDQYMSAEEALNQANQLMEEKKYKQARKKALEALAIPSTDAKSGLFGKNSILILLSSILSKSAPIIGNLLINSSFDIL